MGEESYRLQLYVAGNTERSLRTVRNIRRICTDRLADDYTLEVFDLYQQPELASRVQVIAAPTLIKLLPLPVRRLVGDMADSERVLTSLGLATAKTVT